MIPALVTPYSFRGSVVDIEAAVERFRDLGYRSVLIADPNFHAHVLFNEIVRKNKMVPVHSLVVGNKILIAKSKEGYRSLVLFKSRGLKKIRGVVIRDFSGFRPVMYLDKSSRKSYEAMRKILGLKPLDGDFSLETREEDPLTIGDFEVYDLREKQVFPNPPRDWIDIQKFPEGWRRRLEYEYDLIRKKRFENYFRAVQIIVETAKQKGITVGPGRGSAVGSLFAYAIGITSVNPLDYDLLFERFINEGRKEMPDIDIDVEDERRRELIKLLEEEFTFVSLISTYATLKENSLKKALKSVEEYSKKTYRELYGLPVKRSIHAAGIIVSSEDMVLPYYEDDGLKVCEYDMNSLKTIGVEKIDVLGLKTLSFLKKLSEETEEDFSSIDKNVRAVYEMISNGTTSAVFQLESSEARKIAKYVSPKNMKELSDVLALNRPGPLKAKLHIEYLNRRLGKAWKVPKKVEDVLKDTHGLPIYQEQIMMMAVEMAGMNLSEADELRKAVARKDPKRMLEVLDALENGLKRNGYTRSEIEEIVEFIKKFSSYAFNKSHSVAYAHISYYLTYYKYKYFPQFLLSFLKHSPYEREKIDLLLKEAQFLGYRILLPSVEEPFGGFRDMEIRLPIGVVRGIDRDLPEKIAKLDRRKVSDVLKLTNQAAVENLIKAGAFDSIYPSRREALAALKSGEPPEVLKSLKEKFGKVEKKVKGEGISDRILLEKESMGFAISVPDFDSRRPKIAESYSLWEARAVHVLSMGNGVITDGRSVIFSKGLPDGELMVILDPERGITKWTKNIDEKIKCNKRILDVRIGCWEEFAEG